VTINNFIPTVWSARILENLNNAHVYAPLLNRDYEGEIRQAGDTVKINSIGRVAVFDYTKNADLADPEVLDDSQLILAITEGKAFNFQIDDVDKAQQKPQVMSEAMREAAWALADVEDLYVAALLAAGVATASPDNTLTAVTLGTGAGDADAYETLVNLSVKLDESNVPKNGRWCVIPPWVHGLLSKDPRFVSFNTDAARRQIRGEPITEIQSMMISVSNNVPVSGSAYTILAGYKAAATFADQLTKTEAFRMEKRFADGIKGLHLYGAKVTRPYALASVAATAA